MQFHKEKFGKHPDDASSMVSGAPSQRSSTTNSALKSRPTKDMYEAKLKEIEDQKREKEFLKKRTQALVQAMRKSQDKIDLISKDAKYSGVAALEPNYMQKHEIVMDDIHSDIDRESFCPSIPSSLSSALSQTT